MDDIVRQAMAKWPNVPHCYGWLGLDARGNWYMRDDVTQAAGKFSSGAANSKGSRLQHRKLLEFIERNYQSDEHGQWYFQNGPQRVFVELEETPWIWRVNDTGQVTTHTNEDALYKECFVDERGWVYLRTDKGFGLIHSQDVHQAANAIERGDWTTQDVTKASLPNVHKYCTSPAENQIKSALQADPR
jgi:hypothetical protein